VDQAPAARNAGRPCHADRDRPLAGSQRAAWAQTTARNPSAGRRPPGRDVGQDRQGAGRPRNRHRDVGRRLGAGQGRDAGRGSPGARSCRRSRDRDAGRALGGDRSRTADRDRDATPDPPDRAPWEQGGAGRGPPGRGLPHEGPARRADGLNDRRSECSRYGGRHSVPARWTRRRRDRERPLGARRSRRVAVTQPGSGARNRAAASHSLPDQILPVATAGGRACCARMATRRDSPR
jgi:hypothetical protein